MRKPLLVTLGLALSAASLAAPTPYAPNLRALLQPKQVLCYDAVVEVDGKADTAKEQKAETQLAALLKGLGLTAVEYDAAEACDRVLSFEMIVDNNGAPGIYQGSLPLHTFNGLDENVTLKIATIWDDRNWGGVRGTFTNAEISAKYNALLTGFLRTFKGDFTSVKR